MYKQRGDEDKADAASLSLSGTRARTHTRTPLFLRHNEARRDQLRSHHNEKRAKRGEDGGGERAERVELRDAHLESAPLGSWAKHTAGDAHLGYAMHQRSLHKPTNASWARKCSLLIPSL